MGLQNEIQRLESDALKDAIATHAGNLVLVASALGMAKSTLTSKLDRKYPDLLEHARELRDRSGNGRGRPRKAGDERSKKAVAAAWKKSCRTYSLAARELGIPASTCRELVTRYGLPTEKLKTKLKATTRNPKTKTKTKAKAKRRAGKARDS